MLAYRQRLRAPKVFLRAHLLRLHPLVPVPHMDLSTAKPSQLATPTRAVVHAQYCRQQQAPDAECGP